VLFRSYSYRSTEFASSTGLTNRPMSQIFEHSEWFGRQLHEIGLAGEQSVGGDGQDEEWSIEDDETMVCRLRRSAPIRLWRRPKQNRKHCSTTLGGFRRDSLELAFLRP
jgi:hypothetical protein